MKIHRFIVPFELKDNKTIELSDFGILHQITRVLRLKKDEQLIVCDGHGQEYRVGIGEVLAQKAQLYILEKINTHIEPKQKVTLYACILKGEHFELLAQKATEVGIHALVPVVSERTIKLSLKPARIEKIMKESAEQSGRSMIPLFLPPLSLKEAFVHSQTHDVRYFFDLDAPLLSPLNEKKFSSVAGFIGPEGGWHPQERELAEKSKCQIVSLTQATLRAETAGIVSAFLLCQ